MKNEEAIKIIDEAIVELVYEKHSLLKAYNYYNGKRDAEQFRHLEANYGIGTPTQIEFTPLVRKHIEALVGEYTSIPTKPRVSCKDENTISNIMREKELKIKSEVFNFYKSKLSNAILNVFSQDGKQLNDPLIEKELNKLISDLDESFISQYEITAQNVLNYIMQARDIDFAEKKETLARDLYITGTAYYKVSKTKNNNHFNIEVLNPIHTFIDRNPNSKYLKNSYRSVIRRYMNKNEILSKYGHFMDDESIKKIKSISTLGRHNNNFYVTVNELDGQPTTNGILAGLEVTPSNITTDHRYFNNKLIEVMEVEWLDVVKEKGEFITNRYEGVRINNDIYVILGKVEDACRSINDPTNTSLSVNGLFFSDRNGEPFSLILATANLQDKLDIICFYRDNLIASSGTKGDWIDVSMLPNFLGDDLQERIRKFYAYKKQMGMAIIDTSQEGRAFNNNTTFAGYDDSLRADVMQAFDYAIQSIENTCSSITGVSRERLANGIEQRDAVTNVEVGVKMSSIITKQYSHSLDCLMKELLTDCLNISKIVYKNGIKGNLILGDKNKMLFTALPEYFTITDYDIHVNDSSEILKDIESIKGLINALIQGGQIDAETAVNAIDSKSLTDLKISVNNSVKKQKEEQGVAAQLNQQLQQAQEELKQLKEQLNKVQKERDNLSNQNSKFEASESEKEREIKWFKARSEDKFKKDTIKSKDKLIEAETLQLYDGNAKNDEIKNIL